MARFCSLFSSSSGNSTLIGTGNCNILIDAGVSAKRLTNALLSREISPESLCAIFVTHEHSDHIKGIRVLASKYNIPVYATEGTLCEMENNGTIDGKFPTFVMNPQGMEVGNMIVRPFKTPHDSKESCAYQIEFPDGRKAAVATDIGHVTNEIMNNILGCELVMLESNHDVGMLENGPYPYMLKRRILSDVGHLSNISCSQVATQLIDHGTTRLFLGHLSKENNMPELAFQTTLSAIQETGAVFNRDYMLKVNPIENLDNIVSF